MYINSIGNCCRVALKIIISTHVFYFKDIPMLSVLHLLCLYHSILFTYVPLRLCVCLHTKEECKWRRKKLKNFLYCVCVCMFVLHFQFHCYWQHYIGYLLQQQTLLNIVALFVLFFHLQTKNFKMHNFTDTKTHIHMHTRRHRYTFICTHTQLANNQYCIGVRCSIWQYGGGCCCCCYGGFLWVTFYFEIYVLWNHKWIGWLGLTRLGLSKWI